MRSTQKKAMKEFEDTLESLLAPYYPRLRIPDGEAVFVHVTYFFAYPKSTPKRNLVDGRRMNQRPDGENLSKAIVDALADRWAKDRRTKKFYVARRGLFADDGAVNPLVVSKFRTTGKPKTVIVVKRQIDTPRKPLTNPYQGVHTILY